MSGNDTFSITVGVDGSAESRTALEWAVGETRLRHGHVRAVTAWEYPPATVGMEGLRWVLTSSNRWRGERRPMP
ncbi:universal stress protein [Arthrobacter sp. MW3 TE3886]|uniref:universal stress protein n=1 Tax=Arthrobacter sp. MW3 TE3886 TaxID=3156254 RepID=UPI0035144A2A